MIAKAFDRVGYPIFPRTPHYSQILPRDFDLSPSFRVMKLNTAEDGGSHSTHPTREQVGADRP
jgi:hypothetical protein